MALGSDPELNAIFGGHSDNGLLEPVVHPDTGTVIGLTFGQGMHLGYTRFEVDTEGHNVKFLGGKLIPVDADALPRDAQTSELIEQVRQVRPELTETVATLKSPAMRLYNRESTIGNLLTDMMREASGSDIAMLNSGGIRSDLNAGAVTREHLMNVYPFVDNLTVIEMTGRQVRDLVAYGLTLPYGIAQFSGLEVTYDSTRPPEQRLIDVRHNGKPLSNDERYTVSTTGFLANGGDGYTMFPEGKVVADELLMTDVLLEGFRSAGTIALPPTGRQQDISGR